MVDGAARTADADAFVAAALETDATILVARPADVDLVDGLGARLRFPSKGALLG